MSDGHLIWITGLSCAGKTTIGKLIHNVLRKEKANVVFLDGDRMRDIFKNILGYTLEDRRKCAYVYSRLCKLLCDQGVDVVCATISMFDDVRAWNRNNIFAYTEVYLKVPFEVLKARDKKGLYSSMFTNGGKGYIVGVDLPYEEPKTPDVVIVNDGSRTPREIVDEVLDLLKQSRQRLKRRHNG